MSLEQADDKKMCSKCGETKLLTDFKKRGAEGGRRSVCWDCRRVPPECNLRRPWTPEEDDLLARLLKSGHSVEEIAPQLEGRSVSSIKNRRQALRKMSGIKPQPSQPWTDVDDAALLDLKQDRAITLKQLASFMARTESSIINRLHVLKTSGAPVPDGRARKEPFYIPRTHKPQWVLAKSCSVCFETRDSRYFIYKTRLGSYDSQCRLCSNKNQRQKNRSDDNNRELLQEITKPMAVNEWKKYTQEDLELITDQDKSELEVALTLGRSYFAVCSQRARLEVGPYGNGPKRLNLTDSRWEINFPAAMEAVREHFQKLGEAVPEELWEWNDEEEMAS